MNNPYKKQNWNLIDGLAYNSVIYRVNDSVRDSVRDSVKDSVWSSVKDSVWSSVGGFLRFRSKK
jgi:hypothetical protein